jgi:hypothetical protein
MTAISWSKWALQFFGVSPTRHFFHNFLVPECIEYVRFQVNTTSAAEAPVGVGSGSLMLLALIQSHCFLSVVSFIFNSIWDA